MEVASVPVIVAIVYAVLGIYKQIVTSEKWMRLIPIWAACLGVILGVLGFYLAPTVIPAEDVLTAILIGAASGLAATGVNQITKQINKNAADKNKTDSKTEETETKG